MIYYAIKIKNTNKWFPNRWPNKKPIRRGFTSSEPVETQEPRLFISMQSAIQFLKWWKSGKWYNVYCSSGWSGEPDIDLKNKVIEERKFTEFEIVKFKLVRIKCQ